MKAVFSILHISDLHKGENANLDNLYTSLVVDCDDYVQNGIPKPAIIVVSGDIINGDNTENANAVIDRQYMEAESFLNKLCDYFCDGDKGRIIMYYFRVF